MHNVVMKNFMILRNAATLWAAFCLVPSVALAQTTPTPPPLFVSIGDKPAILYDGLSTKANKIFILSRFRPVEVLVKLDKWTKVRDADNAIGWMENSSIGEKRYVQVSSNAAEIRVAPNANAAVVFEAQRTVTLEATGIASTDGWLPVRHRDGQTGFVRILQVWGT
jgi:SH3-like domain-containing protein